MKNAATYIKILTILSYFLPSTFFFVSCDNLSFEIAYNKKEAQILIESNRLKTDTISLDSTSVSSTTLVEDSTVTDSTKIKKEAEPTRKDYFHNFLYKTCFPTNETLSSLGAVKFYKDIYGRIFMGISILISFILLFEKVSKFIHEKVKVLYSISIASVVLFILHSFFISNVELIWGIWIVLILNIICLIIKLKIERSESNFLEL